MKIRHGFAVAGAGLGLAFALGNVAHRAEGADAVVRERGEWKFKSRRAFTEINP